MDIGIDLTWLKPNSGGLESHTRNLLDAILDLPDQNNYYFLVAKDNIESLSKYKQDKRVKFILCNTYATKIRSHLIWQNLFIYKVLKKNNLSFCFFPTYQMPFYKCKKIKCVTTIHDIQALYYPQYFPLMVNIWLRLSWKATARNADAIITISDYTKKDIEKNYNVKSFVKRIYIPITLNDGHTAKFSELATKYNLKKGNYYYTVSSLYKHKNLKVLVDMLVLLKEQNSDLPNILVISGAKGPASHRQEILDYIKEKKVEDNIILTKFVTNDERNELIKNCHTFVFPSIFEGFGMPPVEALMLGARVVTTKCTSLKEATQNKCLYVNDPYNAKEWIKKIKQAQKLRRVKYKFPEYEKEQLAREHLDLFYKINNKETK